MVMQERTDSTLSIYLYSTSVKQYVCGTDLHSIYQEHVYGTVRMQPILDEYLTYNIYIQYVYIHKTNRHELQPFKSPQHKCIYIYMYL